MLHFLRKHQKVFLSIVAIFTIASFLFFGSYNAMQPGTTAPDRIIGKTLQGTPLMYDELILLTRFLNTSPHERQLFEKGAMPNLLNDGVVQKDFLETGFAVMSSEWHFDLIKTEIEQKLERVKNYSPYVHPRASFLSAEAIWQQFLPNLHRHYETLLKKRDADPEAMALLIALYLDQTQFPPDMLRNILKYHQGLYDGVVPDPILNQGDLSLFGFTTLEDWLGKRFVNILAQVILQGAAIAKEQGYIVTAEEARASLHENVRTALHQLGNKEITLGQLEQVYQRQTTALHWQEEKVVAIWQKVLLFRKMFLDQGSRIVIDPQSLAAAAVFAEEQIQIDLYRLPQELELKSFRDLLKLQTYIAAVSMGSGGKSKNGSLGLPVFYASTQEIEKRVPELVQEKYGIELQSVSMGQLIEHVALKEVYAWELKEAHWGLLCEAFPILRNAPFAAYEERYKALNSLSVMERATVDLFAKQEIVKTHPEWLIKAFEKAPKHQVALNIRSQGGDLPFEGNVDREELKQLLKNTSIGEMVSYSPNPENHYRMTVLSSTDSQEIVTFAEARRDGTLDRILDRQLALAYPDVRKKHSALFALKEGGWKPIKEVQDLVGAEIYAEVLKNIEMTSQSLGISWSDHHKDSLDEYAKYRFIGHINEARLALSAGAAEEGWVQASTDVGKSIDKQWYLLKEKHTLNRTEAKRMDLQNMFELEIGQWSFMQLGTVGEERFCFLHEKISKKANTDPVLDKTRRLLSVDAQRVLFADLLKKLAEQNLMVISSLSDDET
ncbi:MAG: hypothetical protein KGZ39_00565 [Simkania sp.]|nr:hypothetical protein [Simkania sp.]